MKRLQRQGDRRPGRGVAAHRPAFTLLELIWVAVILGILAAVAVPHYSGFVAREKTMAAARRVAADLALAQRKAQVSSASQKVTFYAGSGVYQLPDQSDPDHPAQSYEVDLADEPYSATIVSAVFGTDGEVVFDGYGVPDTAGQVVLAVGKYRQIVTLDSGTGRPRMAGQVSVQAAE